MRASKVTGIPDIQRPRLTGHATSGRGGRLRTRVGPVVVAAATACVCSFGSAGADCIDYGDFLHWVGSVDTPGNARGMAVSGTYAYVADDDSGLQVIDITNPASPQIVGSVDTPGEARGDRKSVV